MPENEFEIDDLTMIKDSCDELEFITPTKVAYNRGEANPNPYDELILEKMPSEQTPAPILCSTPAEFNQSNLNKY